MLQLVCNNCWRLTGYVLYEVTLQMFQMVPFFGSGGRAPQLTLPETRPRGSVLHKRVP
jgi:hypothetical protein